ncbi:MAG: hypothetical protein QXL89_00570 [Nitrososphaeria archaeon]
MKKFFETSLIIVFGALYAVVGYFTFFGINFYGVRFWPAVVIPATAAVLFGERVGGASAALGIFVSDILAHGMAILSLTVGMPSNFIAFYIIGKFCRKYSLRRYLASATLGLLVGSFIIGIGLFLWSQAFPLPFSTNITPLALEAIFSISLWTFVSEIPFLYILVPPIVKAIKGRVEGII